MRFFYSGGAILYTTNSNNTIMTENVLDLYGNTIASWRDRDLGREEAYFYHYDKRGSTTAIVDSNGNVVKQYTYDEFGNMDETGTFDNEVTFTGSITGTSTGLQYMNARFYEPTTGRFISQDSYTGNPYDPWTQHLYSYCGNNPTNFVDPTGHKATSADMYKLASHYSTVARTLKKSSSDLLDAAELFSKMWKFEMSDKLVSASQKVFKLSRYFYKLARITRKNADEMALGEKKKPVERYSELDAVIDSIVGDIGAGPGIGISGEVAGKLELLLKKTIYIINWKMDS